jgi:hypothetical protein
MATYKQLYKKWVSERTQATKARRKEQVELVLSKENVETLEDIIRIYYGLSEKSKENIVFQAIYRAARLGFLPKEIIEQLQVKKKKSCTQENKPV